MMKKTNKKSSPLILILITLCLLTAGITLPGQQEEKELNYNVSVDALALPIFAVDKKGDPVYDIAQDELELLVDGKPVDIIFFNRYAVNYSAAEEGAAAPPAAQAGSQPAQSVPQPEAEQEAPERSIFIIMDGMFNSRDGFVRTKLLTQKLIRSAPEGDRFFVFQNTPGGGLKFIGGPESWREDLIELIDRIPALKSTFDGVSGKDIAELNLSVLPRYVKELSRFKYVLRLINGPKIVYLISEGPTRGMALPSLDAPSKEIAPDYTENLEQGREPLSNLEARTGGGPGTTLIQFLKMMGRISRAVNDGGGVLYGVNSEPLDPEKLILQTGTINDSQASLRHIAETSGGKYFAGSKVDTVIQNIRKTTSAYYEAMIYLPPWAKKSMDISVTCKRDNVRLYTLNRSHRHTPYPEMDETQKKIFALNVATGGDWARMIGTADKIKYKKKGRGKKASLQVPLPAEMKNKELEVFTIHMDRQSEEVDMDFRKLEAQELVTLSLRKQKGKDSYFVIVDPAAVRCVYNRLN